MPASWLEAPGWSLVPVAGEVDESWAAVIPAGGYVTLGWQGMLRELVPGREVARRAPTPSALLRRADLVGVSHHDVPAGTSLADLTAFLHPGADLLVTEGAQGGTLLRVGTDGAEGTVRYRPTATDRETDPTGAGDTFLAALMASVLRPAIVGRRACPAVARICASRPPPARSRSRTSAWPGSRIGLPSWSAVPGNESAWRSARARTRRSSRSNRASGQRRTEG